MAELTKEPKPDMMAGWAELNAATPSPIQPLSVTGATNPLVAAVEEKPDMMAGWAELSKKQTPASAEKPAEISKVAPETSPISETPDMMAGWSALQGMAQEADRKTVQDGEKTLAPEPQSLTKRFSDAWNAPGEGIVGHTWGVLNTPIIAESDIESWLGDPKEQFGSLFGGIAKGVYDLAAGMTAPLSLAFLVGSMGAGSLLSSGGKALLLKSGKSAAEIGEIVKGSELFAKATKLGKTADQAWLDVQAAGLNKNLITDGVDILNKAGMTSHDLLKGGLIHTAGSAVLRSAGMSIPKAELAAKSAQILVDGGFAAVNVYGAAAAFPQALDALKEGDTETAARLITASAGMAGFGLLGTKAVLKEAGGMMDPFLAKTGLHVKWNEENQKLSQEFGVRDRQMVERGRYHELWAEDIRKNPEYQELIKKGDLQGVFNLIQAAGDENVLRRRYNLVAESAGVADRLSEEQPIRDLSSELPAGGGRTRSDILQERLDKVPNARRAFDPVNELTENELQQLSVGKRREMFLNVLERLPSVKDLVATAKKGAIGRDWYERSIQAFDSMRDLAPKYFRPEEADVWAGVVAATSPQQGVPINLREALDFWKGWVDNGRPNTEKKIIALQKKGKLVHLTNQPSKLPNVLRAINGEDMLPGDRSGYYKVGNFAANLKGISKNATFDSWMGIFHGLSEDEVASSPFYHAMAVQTRLAARELGWEPAQVQAAVWTFTKTLAEMSGWKSPEGGEFYKPKDLLKYLSNADMAGYSKDFADIMYTDREVRGRLLRLGVDLNELDRRLRKIPRPEAAEEPVEGGVGKSLGRAAERIGESQEGLKGFPGYSKYQPGAEFDFGTEPGVKFGEQEVAEKPSLHPLTEVEDKTPFTVRMREKLGDALGRLKTADGSDTAAGLYKNRRGEYTVFLAKDQVDAINKISDMALETPNGVSSNAAQTNQIINFLSKDSNPRSQELGKLLEKAVDQPVSFVKLEGPDPYRTMLHEHVHGVLTRTEAKVVLDQVRNMPGYKQLEDHIRSISAKGKSYSEEAIPSEIMSRIMAGQLYGIEGLDPKNVDAILWEALNNSPSEIAYQKLVGNLAPDVRRRVYAYLQPEGEGRGVPAEFAAGTERAGGPRAEVGAMPTERGPGRVPAGPGREAIAADLPERIEAQIDLEHHSNVEKLTKVEPSKYGTSGVSGAEGKRKAAFPEFWVDRAYFNIKGTPPEALIEGRKYTYGTKVPEKELYDLKKDPEGYLAKAQADLKAQGRVPVNAAVLTRAEQMMSQDGKSGYVVGNNVAMFKPTDVSIPFELPAEVKTSLEGQNLKEAEPKVEVPEKKGKPDFSDLPADMDSERLGTSAARLKELAAKKKIKEKYTPKEIEALLRSYDPSHLTQSHRNLAAKISEHFNETLSRAQQGGALEEGLENYVTHMWEKDADNPAANRLLADAHAGNFSVYTPMAHQRIFEHAVEGQLHGRKLAVTDPIALAAHNGNTFDRVVSTRKLLERLRNKNLRASDGRPMVALSGSGHVVQGIDGENPAVIVHPDRMHSIRISDEVVQGLRDSGDLDRLVKSGKIIKYGERTPIATDRPSTLATEQRVPEIATNQRAEVATEGPQHYAWATHDYLSVNHRAFEGWRVPTQDTNGNPVMMRSDLKVHPDAYDYVKRQIQTQSDFAKALKPVFGAGREAKGILLSFDVFHLVQEGLRAVMTGVSPFGVEKWDLRTNPTLGKLVEAGLTMKEYGAIDSFQEGQMVGHSHLLSKVPVVGKAATWFQDFLFQKYVPGLKARAAEHLYERYKKLYPEYTDEKVLQLAAEDTNMRFGGLNLRREGRALATQDVFRLVALAPDWLESEMRAMGRAMGGDGRVMRRDLAKVAVGLWLAARVLNQLNTGNSHYEAPFGVAYKDEKGREKVVSLRTLPTDMLHAVTDPMKFMRYRASPLERTISTVYTGRDEQGRRLPTRDLVWDILGDSVVPLPLQNVTKKMSGFAPEQSWKELGIRGAGAQVTTFKTEAQKKAAELSADRSESGPVDPSRLKEHAAKLEVEDNLRAGLTTTEDLNQMVEQGLMTPKDAKGIIKNLNQTRGMAPDLARLYTRASRLDMPEFLEVWEKATAGEKSTLTRLLLKKKATYFKKFYMDLTPAEQKADPTYRKLREMFPDQLAF
jgi:hypothetical protein